MKNLNPELRPLKTNIIMNCFQFILWLATVFLMIDIKQQFSFYGLESVLFFAIFFIIFWFYEIKFYGEFIQPNDCINVIVKRNLLGFSYISIINDKTVLLNRFRIRKRYYKVTKESLDFEMELSGNGVPCCSVVFRRL